MEHSSLRQSPLAERLSRLADRLHQFGDQLIRMGQLPPLSEEQRKLAAEPTRHMPSIPPRLLPASVPVEERITVRLPPVPTWSAPGVAFPSTPEAFRLDAPVQSTPHLPPAPRPPEAGRHVVVAQGQPTVQTSIPAPVGSIPPTPAVLTTSPRKLLAGSIKAWSEQHQRLPSRIELSPLLRDILALQGLIDEANHVKDTTIRAEVNPFLDHETVQCFA